MHMSSSMLMPIGVGYGRSTITYPMGFRYRGLGYNPLGSDTLALIRRDGSENISAAEPWARGSATPRCSPSLTGMNKDLRVFSLLSPILSSPRTNALSYIYSASGDYARPYLHHHLEALMSIRIDGGYSPATHLLITMSRWLAFESGVLKGQIN